MSHGSRTFDPVAPRSKFYQGPFGRICGDLEPWSPGVDEAELEAHLLAIARNEMVELPGKTPTEIAKDNALISELEERFSSQIPAGYTYFGQFVDHDITFDPASSLMRRNDPGGLLNHRTPRLDLDSVYGRGPDDSPYLYDQTDKAKFLIGSIRSSKLRDLPRNQQGRALIGDMRNDENAIVSQLQLAFLLAHNTLVERAKNLADPFFEAQRTLRWLYQYIVWNDFLAQITQEAVWSCGLRLDYTCDNRRQWTLGLSDVYSWRDQPFIPVEFSVAAYRMGHSMVRNGYQTNHPHRGAGNFAPIFDVGAATPDDLRGFRPMSKENTIQWDWFLPMKTSASPFPQRARQLDTKLANSLAALPEGDTPDSPLNVLAFRNLLRGIRFGLPAGTAAAKKFGVTPIEIPPGRDALWFYILKEAEETERGERLGHLGSLIVSATFAGLLKGDPSSWINQMPEWSPEDEPLLREEDKQDADSWTLAAIIRLSGLPVDAGDVSAQS